MLAANLAPMTALRKTSAAPGLAFETVAVPDIGPSDVLIRVRKAGICGTDHHIDAWDAWAQRRIVPPLTVGHEFVGTIEAVGAAVRGLDVGRRVCGEGHISCGTCRLCRTGDAHICERVRIIGVDTAGAFATYIAMPAHNVWRLDPAIPDDVAAVFDPLGNAVHTVMAAGVATRSVAITGVGSIGLMAIPVARAAGAASVFAIDVNPAKLALAERVGADAVFDGRDPNHVDEIRRRTNGDGVDVLLEMSGAAPAIDAGLRMLRSGGRAALLGIPPDDVRIALAERIIFKGLTVLGINGRKMFETWYQMEALVKSGRVDLGPIITHVMPFAAYRDAFDAMAAGTAAKIVLDLETV